MVGKPPKRHHHTVQKAYLKGFANKKFLRRVPLAGELKTIGIGDATVVKDFYNTMLTDGTLDDSYERHLDATYEDPFSRALAELLRTKTVPVAEPRRTSIAQWVALQMLRTPTARSMFDDLSDMFLRDRLGIKSPDDLGRYLRDRGRPTDDLDLQELYQEYRGQRGRTIKGDASKHQRFMNSQIPLMADLVKGRGWTLINCFPHVLVTSDSPVVIRLPRTETARTAGRGAGEFVVPLNRHVALVAEEESTDDRWVTGDAQTVHRINGEVAMNAREAIYHHPADDPLAGLHLHVPKPYRNQGVEDWLDALVHSPILAVERTESESIAADVLAGGHDREQLMQLMSRAMAEINSVVDDLAEYDAIRRNMNLPMWPAKQTERDSPGSGS
jgi:hypothetical protein